MNFAAFDWRLIATVAIFLATLAGVAFGRAPLLRTDRAGIALIGASLMVAVGPLGFEDALKSVNLDTITLLLGMMIIVAHLRVSGLFDLAGGWAVRRARGPLTFLAAIIALTGFFSAFLVNDAICLMMAPLVIEVTRLLKRNPVPYLLAVAMASNAGSVATFTGNPQNMIIGVASHIPYAQFAMRLAPVAVVALALAFCLIALSHRSEFSREFEASAETPQTRIYPWQMGKSVLAAAGVVIAFFAGAPVAKAAIIGGSLLLVSRTIKPQKIYAEIDGGLLLLFAGLFIVVASAEKAILTPDVMAAAGRLHLGDVWILSGVTAVLSNLISNVPAVLVLRPFIDVLPNSTQAWLVAAMSSTLAGNLTLLGSIANLIVAEQARRAGVSISFWAYLKVGMPLTLLSLAFGAWRLSH